MVSGEKGLGGMEAVTIPPPPTPPRVIGREAEGDGEWLRLPPIRPPRGLILPPPPPPPTDSGDAALLVMLDERPLELGLEASNGELPLAVCCFLLVGLLLFLGLVAGELRVLLLLS